MFIFQTLSFLYFVVGFLLLVLIGTGSSLLQSNKEHKNKHIKEAGLGLIMCGILGIIFLVGYVVVNKEEIKQHKKVYQEIEVQHRKQESDKRRIEQYDREMKERRENRQNQDEAE